MTFDETLHNALQHLDKCWVKFREDCADLTHTNQQSAQHKAHVKALFDATEAIFAFKDAYSAIQHLPKRTLE